MESEKRKRRATRWLVAAWLALWAACSAVSPAAAQQPARGITPKVVLQTHPDLVEVAAWVPESSHVVIGAGFLRQLLVVEAETGHIVNRIGVPPPGGGGEASLLFTSLAMSADGNTARLTGAAMNSAGETAARAWTVDLARQSITPAPAAGITVPPAAADPVPWMGALVVLHEGGTDMSPAAAEALLPKLPPSPDGRFRLKRTTEGLEITDSQGGGTILAGRQTGLQISDAALAPDGTRLALVFDFKDADDTGRRVGTDLSVFDLATARFGTPIKLQGNYDVVRWLDGRRLLVAPASDFGDRTSEDIDVQGAQSPARIIDAATGRVERSLPPACHVSPLAGGAFVGAAPANCRAKAGKGGGVLRLDPAGGQWRPYPGELGETDFAGRLDFLVVSADGTRIAIAASIPQNGDNAAETIAAVFDAATGNQITENMVSAEGEGSVLAIAFAPDGRTLLVASEIVRRWDYATGAITELPLPSVSPSMFATDGRTLLVAGLLDAEIARMDLGSGKPAAPLALGNAVKGGFVAGKPWFWAVSGTGSLRLWDMRSWRPVLSTWFFEDQRFLAVGEDGRYDSNLGSDEAPFRWLMADDPWLSLGPQTFMRDYYEPRLTEKLLRCTEGGTCAKVLPPLPPIAGLNRVLPEVRIVDVKPAADAPDWAVVTVEVTEGEDREAANGKTLSGVYDVRLLRDGRLVSREPRPESAAGPPRVLDDWRKVHRLPGASPGKPVTVKFMVQVRTRAEKRGISFAAYAYNEDRVKSETDSVTYEHPGGTPRKPRAYVVTIGIDHYDEARLKLNFASADARLIGERLGQVPGYEVHRMALIGEKTPGGARRVTAETIRAALYVLTGVADPKDAAVKALLEGTDISGFEGATPDDLVIISFSGHGWASPSGDFYLVPADAKWPLGAALPDTDTLISADELTLWLSFIDARETVFVIDACHSGASVEAAGFKPGPMGDAGLGQLAFDKGIRILAAAQGDELAQEDPRLGQGLLTYALAAEGIDGAGFGRADLNGDGRIVIEEWLRYATSRLTTLSAEARAGKVAAVPLTRNFAPFNPAGAAPPKVQEPALFDFTREPSNVALRTGGGARR